MRRQQKLLLTVVGLVVMVSLSLWGYLTWQVNQNYVPKLKENYTFSIVSGESAYWVAERLVREGFLKNPFALKVYLRLHPNLSNSIQAGEYQITPGASALQVLQGFQNGSFQEKLRFIEGWRREQYAAYLVKEKGAKFARQFLQLSQGQEGYLSPDTYFIDQQTLAQDLLEKINDNYQQKISDLQQQIQAHSLSEKEIVILASIVEREVTSQEDRAVVAGILLKRLENGWPLEADATVQYVLANEKEIRVGGEWAAVNMPKFDWWPKIKSRNEIDIDSEFNTRKIKGLPPHAIANPSLESIQAVLSPLDSEYWYYLTDASGVTRYAETLPEHNRNIQKFGLSGHKMD